MNNFNKITLKNNTEVSNLDILTMLMLAFKEEGKLDKIHVFPNLYEKGIDYALTIQISGDRLTATLGVHHAE